MDLIDIIGLYQEALIENFNKLAQEARTEAAKIFMMYGVRPEIAVSVQALFNDSGDRIARCPEYLLTTNPKARV